MKRKGIWTSQSRWQNGHYQSVEEIKKGVLSYRMPDGVIEFTFDEGPEPVIPTVGALSYRMVDGETEFKFSEGS